MYEIEYTVFENKYKAEKSLKLPIKSFIFIASRGGNISVTPFVAYIAKIFSVLLFTISRTSVSEWLIKYTRIETTIVSIFDINVEKNSTIESSISSFKKLNSKEKRIKVFISIHWKISTHKNKSDCKAIIRKIVIENHTNFQSINSDLFIGLLRIRKIVFHSISLKSSWLHTNKTQTSQNISIIASQKSTMIFHSFPRDKAQREILNIIKTRAKTRIRYKNLFLVISRNVLIAILNI